MPSLSRHTFARLLVAATVAAALLANLPPPVSATGTPFATESAFLTSSVAHSPTNWQAFDGNDFALHDVNHDGKPEIVISNDNLRHYVIDPRVPAVAAEMSTTYYSGYGGRDLDAP